MSKITVVYKAPEHLPKVMQIDNTLDDIQRLVDGHFEILRCGVNVVCVCNEEGAINGMEPNIYVDGELIFGPLFFVGVHVTSDGEDFCDIPLLFRDEIIRQLAVWGYQG